MTNEEMQKEQARLRGDGPPQSAEVALPIPRELQETTTGVDPAERAKILDLYTTALNGHPPSSWSPRQKKLLKEHCESILRKL